MKLKLRATVKHSAGSENNEIMDAISTFIDKHDITGMPEGGEMDSIFLLEHDWNVTDGDGRGIDGMASGQMAVRLPDGSGIDGQFSAVFKRGKVVSVTFSAPAYED